MNRRRAALTTVLLTVLAAACGEGPTTTREHAPAERLHGSWRWVRSLDVSTQQLHTPATDGFEAVIRFTALTPYSGTFAYSRTGQATVEGVFGISYEDAPGNDFITLEPGIDFVVRNAWVAAGRDSMWLGGVFEGGYNSMYARVHDAVALARRPVAGAGSLPSPAAP